MIVTTTRPAAGPLSSEQVSVAVRSAADGDPRGWSALVREFGGMIRAIAHAHGLRDDDAADVGQTTWLKLVEHVADLNEPARVGAWLATTTGRECLRLLRESQRQLLLGDDTPEWESQEPRPVDGLLVAERNRALRDSLSRLRTRDQALLRLLVADHRPDYEEISARLAMPIGSIGPTRARALARLRRQLESDRALHLVSA